MASRGRFSALPLLPTLGRIQDLVEGGLDEKIPGKAISRVLKDNCKLPHAFETTAFLAVLIMDYS